MLALAMEVLIFFVVAVRIRTILNHELFGFLAAATGATLLFPALQRTLLARRVQLGEGDPVHLQRLLFKEFDKLVA